MIQSIRFGKQFIRNKSSKMFARPKFEVIPPKLKHEATVFIFHGSGDSAINFKHSLLDVRKNFQFDNVKIILPAATPKPYTAAGGFQSNVWYDREDVHIDKRECRQSLKEAHKLVESLIDEEGKHGIPPERIVIGGFSMGAGLALHSGIIVNHNLAGIFSVGAFLHNDSMIYETLKNETKEHNAKLPQILMTHCLDDMVVPIDWSHQAYQQIKDQGVRIEYHAEPFGGHSIRPDQLELIVRFIRKRLQLDEDESPQ